MIFFILTMLSGEVYGNFNSWKDWYGFGGGAGIKYSYSIFLAGSNISMNVVSSEDKSLLYPVLNLFTGVETRTSLSFSIRGGIGLYPFFMKDYTTSLYSFYGLPYIKTAISYNFPKITPSFFIKFNSLDFYTLGISMEYKFLKEKEKEVATREEVKKEKEKKEEKEKPARKEPVEETVQEPPFLTFTDSLIETNSNGIVEGLERIELRIEIENKGKGKAKDVKVVLSGDSRLLDYIGREKKAGDIEPGEKKVVSFIKTLPTNIPKDEGSFTISVEEANGYDAPRISKIRVAMRPAEKLVEEKVMFVDVDIPLEKKKIKDKNAIGVVIGISSYLDPMIPEVKYARRDAEIMSQYMRDALGIPQENMFEYYDMEATKASLDELFFEKLPKIVDEHTRLYIYYAGHGTPDEKGIPYLVPCDGKLGSKMRMLSLEKLYKNFKENYKGEIYIFLDACFSGRGRSVLASNERPLIPLKVIPEKGNYLVFSAAKSDQVSHDYDEVKHGLFTYYLLLGMRGKADVNKDGKITVEELYNFVKENVKEVSIKKFTNVQEPDILPVQIFKEKKDYVLIKTK